jgi:hypothetical protein
MLRRWLDLVRITFNHEDADLYLLVSRWDRLLIFGGCNLGALACFVIVFALWPVMIAKPKKFAIL